MQPNRAPQAGEGNSSGACTENLQPYRTRQRVIAAEEGAGKLYAVPTSQLVRVR